MIFHGVKKEERIVKKVILVLLVLCLFLSYVPSAYADNEDGDYSIISNYTKLLQWRDAGCPSEGTNKIVVSGDFGWPTEEVVLDFGVKPSGSEVILYNSNIWTIPENVTIKNLGISLADKSTLNIDGKVHNNLYYEEGNAIEFIRATNATINLGKNAEVKGSVHLCKEAVLNSNGGYAEEIIASVNGGTTNKNMVTISGTLKADTLNHHNNMSINIAPNSIIEVSKIAGNSTNTINIENGATVFYTSTYINFMTNINIKSGGVMSLLFTPLTIEEIFTIEEGGICNAYQGVNQRAQLSNAKIKGAGTINLYGNWAFSYDGTDYYENPNVKNPGTIAMLDKTIVIKEMQKCDHADGRAYKYFAMFPEGGGESTYHMKRCSSCYEGVEGTQASHTYELEGDYDNFKRYRCVCGRSYTVEKTTGTCGEDIAFVIDGGTIRLDGVGAITEFVPTNGTWAEAATGVKKVILGSGITAVSENAFSAFESIEQVEFDGKYENWKAIDIKPGNDALKYAEVSFTDNSVLLSLSEEYRTKADLLYKENSDTKQIELFLITESENADKMTEDEIKNVKIIVASYGEGKVLSDINFVAPTFEEDSCDAKWTVNIPTDTYKLFVWDNKCTKLTR